MISSPQAAALADCPKNCPADGVGRLGRTDQAGRHLAHPQTGLHRCVAHQGKGIVLAELPGAHPHALVTVDPLALVQPVQGAGPLAATLATHKAATSAWE